ncbi:hypothetical protein ACFVIM_27670 [Streptomyces sp. NPDC057638]|uniref:hypothetical protein n=1 Tax=Streptomyces sp. NPDC057638 TaxID=3346190 RepID=UPI00369656F9
MVFIDRQEVYTSRLFQVFCGGLALIPSGERGIPLSGPLVARARESDVIQPLVKRGSWRK